MNSPSGAVHSDPPSGALDQAIRLLGERRSLHNLAVDQEGTLQEAIAPNDMMRRAAGVQDPELRANLNAHLVQALVVVDEARSGSNHCRDEEWYF